MVSSSASVPPSTSSVASMASTVPPVFDVVVASLPTATWSSPVPPSILVLETRPVTCTLSPPASVCTVKKSDSPELRMVTG